VVELEQELADLHRKEAALVFSSGLCVQTRPEIATIAKLIPDCLILSDELNHNSMIEGVRPSGLREADLAPPNDVDHSNDCCRRPGKVGRN